jgi:hypothetical protein
MALRNLYKAYRRKPVDFSLADECVPVMINLDAEYTLVLSINSLALSKIQNNRLTKMFVLSKNDQPVKTLKNLNP